jgi:hypothetical protein
VGGRGEGGRSGGRLVGLWGDGPYVDMHFDTFAIVLLVLVIVIVVICIDAGV